MTEITLTKEQVKERADVQKKAPTESDFVGKKGYWRKYRDDGSYEWGYRFKPNDKGKVTSQFSEVGAMMKPFMVADTERNYRMQKAIEREALRDTDGNRHFVDAASAEAIARKNGWGHSWRARGEAVRGGVGGMLWRYVRHKDEWEPTGKTCLGNPVFGDGIARGQQFDPYGNEWFCIEGKWVEL